MLNLHKKMNGELTSDDSSTNFSSFTFQVVHHGLLIRKTSNLVRVVEARALASCNLSVSTEHLVGARALVQDCPWPATVPRCTSTLAKHNLRNSVVEYFFDCSSLHRTLSLRRSLSKFSFILDVFKKCESFRVHMKMRCLMCYVLLAKCH